ncbi:unnamed protein product [Cuscuta campestris]|uniref:Uncharacterized protein n=1 Tax=Cuscuta campestris TaxID=132261 RepID=A0A484KC19_9ASTE|nr:unnamed protein product [Cuscuta campestris]
MDGRMLAITVPPPSSQSPLRLRTHLPSSIDVASLQSFAVPSLPPPSQAYRHVHIHFSRPCLTAATRISIPTVRAIMPLYYTCRRFHHLKFLDYPQGM